MTFATDLQATVFYNTYSRWSSEQGRRETWDETVERVVGWMHNTIETRYPQAHQQIPWAELRHAMQTLEVLPSMRMVQMAGPTLDRCHVAAYNCAYLPLQDWQAFGELLYILMQGTGCGFSVEDRYVQQLPTIQPQHTTTAPSVYVIPDTTEGWCDALVHGLTTWANGGDVTFDYTQIRPYGAPLKTKGGKASGPEPLKQLLTFARTLLLNHQGRRLSSINLHDLACYCGSIVQVGGVRRSAEISLSDLHDERMAMAKSGAFWEHAPERSMANNSAVYTKKPTMRQFMHEWTTMMDNGTGERGVFNRGDVNATMPERRAHRDDWGLNPCGEIILRPFEFCNLSIAVARPEDTLSSLKRKVELATLWGTMQSTLTSFQYLRPEWAQNCNNERLLGVDITGQMDCYLLNHAPLRETTYAQCKAAAIAANRVYASWLGIPVSAAVTCVKPSGNSSQLLNVSSGIHPRYAEYYIRRVRIGATSPVASFLRAAGVPHAPEVGQHPLTPSVWVFEFPVMAPREAITRKATTALEQLAQWLDCKLAYTEHNPSCTVYVKEDEWLEVANWLWQHWEAVGGLSFLPYDNGVYMLAPYQEITHDDYVARMAAWPKLDWTQLALFETTDTTDVSREYACTSGACDL